MDSYGAIAGAVKEYWKANYPQDVVAFFQQKYSWDNKWERCEELVECHGSDDYENMTFLSDFCEGQTEVKDVVIIPLREVTAFYYKRKIESHESETQTNADRIRSMSDEELASYLCKAIREGFMKVFPTARYSDEDIQELDRDWLDWLKQEADDGRG